MAYYGYARATQAIDIQIRLPDHDALDDLLEALPIRPQRIDEKTWRFDDRWDVEFYPVQAPLEQEALEHRVHGHLFEEDPVSCWFVPLEALLVFKIREHEHYPQDLKHLDDVRKLLARNHQDLDAKRLEDLLELDPSWKRMWDQAIEGEASHDP